MLPPGMRSVYGCCTGAPPNRAWVGSPGSCLTIGAAGLVVADDAGRSAHCGSDRDRDTDPDQEVADAEDVRERDPARGREDVGQLLDRGVCDDGTVPVRA